LRATELGVHGHRGHASGGKTPVWSIPGTHTIQEDTLNQKKKNTKTRSTNGGRTRPVVLSERRRMWTENRKGGSRGTAQSWEVMTGAGKACKSKRAKNRPREGRGRRWFGGILVGFVKTGESRRVEKKKGTRTSESGPLLRAHKGRKFKATSKKKKRGGKEYGQRRKGEEMAAKEKDYLAGRRKNILRSQKKHHKKRGATPTRKETTSERNKERPNLMKLERHEGSQMGGERWLKQRPKKKSETNSAEGQNSDISGGKKGEGRIRR